MARELEPEPKLWTKVELEAEPKINNFGSATHTKNRMNQSDVNIKVAKQRRQWMNGRDE